MRVAVDAGHGYNTAGKRSAPFLNDITHSHNGKTITVKKGEQLREHVANAGVSQYIANNLEALGLEVYKSGFREFDGTKDMTDPEIAARQKAIADACCDYSISNHFNAYGLADSFNDGQGIETLIGEKASRQGDSLAMATEIQDALRQVYPQKNRGVKANNNLGMTNCAGLGVKACVLIEYAFMTNQTEAECYFANPKAWFNYARAVTHGFVMYLVGGKLPSGEVLQKGQATKQEVIALQMALNKVLGVKMPVDGIWGPKTTAYALQWLQYRGWTTEKTTGQYLGTRATKVLFANL